MTLYIERITTALIRLLVSQAGMRLCCLQIPEDRVSHVEGYVLVANTFCS